MVIGDGPEGRRLRRLAGPSVKFTGRIPDKGVAKILTGARALVVTAVEEFGIAAVEALAAGRPVIALGKGGVRESVQEGVTGVFYEREDPDALAATVLGFDALAIDPAACRAAAERFSVQRFQTRLSAIVDEATRTSGRRGPGSARYSRPACCTARGAGAPSRCAPRLVASRAPSWKARMRSTFDIRWARRKRGGRR